MELKLFHLLTRDYFVMMRYEMCLTVVILMCLFQSSDADKFPGSRVAHAVHAGPAP